MYQHCPFCNIRANRERVDREEKTSSMSRIEAPDEGVFGGDTTRDIVPCVRFLPCGHTFPKQEIERLDRIAKRLRERREEVETADLQDASVELILSELNDLQSQLETMRWRVKKTRVAPEGPVEHEKAFESTSTASILMESGSTIEYHSEAGTDVQTDLGPRGGEYYGTSPVQAAEEYTGSFTMEVDDEDLIEEIFGGELKDVSIGFEENDDVEMIAGVPVVTSDEMADQIYRP